MSISLTHVGVLFGGPSPEHDVSVLTGLQVVRSLQASRRYEQVHSVFWSKQGDFYLVKGEREALDFADGAPQGSEQLSLLSGDMGGFVARRGRVSTKLEIITIDSIVVCTHGGPGEDGSLQGTLDLAGVSYTGPTVASAALGMDKFASGEVVRGAGIASLEREILTVDLKDLGFAGPYIVKPRFGGSSIGIDVVADLDTAKARLGANVHLRRGAVIEPYRSDLYDLQIAMCTYPSLQLSAIERPIRKSQTNEILNYEDKYVGGSGMDLADRELPAVISESLASEIRSAARVAADALGVRGIARIDFLSDGNELYLNEINTIPGSLSRHLFVDPEIAFVDLLDKILAESQERPAAQFSSAGATGALLRDAKSISSKLG
jgi:D-alanine-D-alanine ligase